MKKKNSKFQSHEDSELMNFLKWIHKNPDADDEQIQTALNEVTQNCNTNTFLGLSKMGALSEEGFSPRAGLRKQIKESGAINFATLLGINIIDNSLSDDSEIVVPKGTVVFVINKMNQKRNPFLHVFFAERTGENSEKIYRSLNQGQESSELQTLPEILEQGNYHPPMNCELVFTKKYTDSFDGNVQIVDSGDIQGEIRILSTVGDGNCLIHALFGKIDEFQQYLAGDATVYRKKISEKIFENAEDPENAENLQGPTLNLHSFDHENEVRQEQINTNFLALTMMQDGKYLGLEHLDLIARIQNLNVLVYNQMTNKLIPLRHGDGEDFDHVVAYNGRNHWSKCNFTPTL